MTESSSDKKPVRIMLWGIPRTLSTVFEKCLSYMPGIQIINEPYAYANYYGPESKVWQTKEAREKTQSAIEMGEALGISSKPGWFRESIYTYKWVKDTLEATYPGKSVIFSKDIAHSITCNLDMLPHGFRHTFIIRHPHKVFPSWKGITWKLLQMDKKTFRLQDMPEPYCPKKYGYGELYDLVKYVKQHGEPNPVIIDADDLQRSPASILRQFCQAVAIPFSESLLQWPAGIDILDNHDNWIVNATFVAVNKTSSGGFFDAAFNSTHFLPPSEIPSRDNLTEDVLSLVDASIPYYEKLYEMRIRPSALVGRLKNSSYNF